MVKKQKQAKESKTKLHVLKEIIEVVVVALCTRHLDHIAGLSL